MSSIGIRNRTWAFRSARRRALVSLVCLSIASPAIAQSINKLRHVVVRESGEVTTIRVVAASKPHYSLSRQESPPRIVLDLARCELRDVPPIVSASSRTVQQLRTTQLSDGESKLARVVVDLKRPANYSVRTSGKQLILKVEPRDTMPPAAETPAEAASASRAARTHHGENKSVGAKSAVKPISHINDVRFVDNEQRSEVRIELSKATPYKLIREDGQPLLRIARTAVPQNLQRKLDTRAFSSPVRSVSCYENSGHAMIRLAVQGDVVHHVRKANGGRELVWEIVKPTMFQVNNEKAKSEPKAARYQAPKVAASRTKRRRARRYQGRRIDLDFKDADIHNILRLLSDVGNVNIVTSDAVSGRVTIRMKNVPWDQALDVILRAKGLGQVREGNLLRVAPLADLEKEREAEIARQKQVMLLRPLETRLIPLSYAQAEDVLPKLQYTLSPRGKLTYDDRTNTVIARDIPSNLNLMERMIRNLDTQTPQVMIESRIVEARTNYTHELGIQWGGSFAASSATGNSTGLVFPNQVGIGGGTDDADQPTNGILLGQAANPNFAVNMPAATGLNSGGALGLTLGSVSGAFNVNLRLSAAESSGDIRIISSPKVTTLDNVEAKIEQGVSIPFSQVSAQGVQTQFRDAKLSLTVKPHVTADASVFMKVRIERNEPDFVNTGARGDPSILKKEAQTEMLVKDGDTAVIGGIYTTRDGRAWQKVPWLAEIPILGWLFKTKSDTSDREEVLVFITPRIINRAQSIGR